MLLGIMLFSAGTPVMAKGAAEKTAAKQPFTTGSRALEKGVVISGSVSNPNFPIEDLVNLAELNLKGRNFLFNGNFEKGELKESTSAYITLTLYKGIKYALAIGANSAVRNLKVSIYDEATNELVHHNTVGRNSYKAFLIDAANTGNYYLKITADGVKSDKNAEWMYVYGFKNEQ